VFHIAGRRFEVAVHLGDVQNTIAAAAAAKFKEKAETLPVIVTVAANVVTLTHPTKGENGGDVIVVCDQQGRGLRRDRRNHGARRRRDRHLRGPGRPLAAAVRRHRDREPQGG